MKTLNAPEAPAAIGPYSHAVRSGQLLFLSGQTPLDPASGQLVGGSISDQTHRVFDNLSQVLAAADLGLANVVKVNVYLKDMDDFDGMNAVYAERFGEHRPARTTIAVRQNPLDARVEIECIAEFPSSS
ncbi:MAG: RidA family protein [Acidobacteriota bacterium]